MKRKVRMCLAVYLSSLSLFFTGCTGDSVSTYVEVPVAESQNAPERPTEETVVPAALPDVEAAVGEEADRYMEERFRGLTAPRAFHFPDGHLYSNEDLKVFQVLGLLDGSFYYYYVTRTAGGQEVHAAARYNYKTGDYKLLYENLLDSESGVPGQYSDFYCHLCADNQGRLRLSIYEDGSLSLLTHDGEVVFSRNSEDGGEDFLYLVKSIFGVSDNGPLYYDMDITNVTTDGRYKFYIPVTLYKNDYETLGEHEDLEYVSYLMTYTFSPIGAGQEWEKEYLLQEDLNFNKRVEYWVQLAKYGNSERDGEEDWEEACRKFPEMWGPYHISRGQNSAAVMMSVLMQWKNNTVRNFMEGKKAVSEDVEAVAVPDADSILTEVRQVQEGQSLSGYFFLSDEEVYCPLVGQVGSKSEILKKVNREYTVTRKDSEGKETTETFTDEIQKRFRRKADFAAGSAIEAFSVQENSKGQGVIAGPVREDGTYILGLTLGNACLYMDYNKLFQSMGVVAFPSKRENIDLHILGSREGDNYAMAHYMNDGVISIAIDGKLTGTDRTPGERRFININTTDLNPSGYVKSETDGELTDAVEKRTSSRGADGYTIDSGQMYDNPDIYGKDNVRVIEDGERKNVLFTTFYNGMLYFKTESYSTGWDAVKGTLYQLTDQPLYQAWQTGEDEITAIGFGRTDTTYYYMDIGMAGVYTYSLEECIKNAGSFQVPSVKSETPGQEDKETEGNALNKKPPKLEGTELPTLEGTLKELYEDPDRAPAIEYSTESAETLPDVTIGETASGLKEIWENSPNRRENQE